MTKPTENTSAREMRPLPRLPLKAEASYGEIVNHSHQLRMRFLQAEVREWAKAKGWWDDGRTFGDHIALVHSELSEALEAFRDWGPTQEMQYFASDDGGFSRLPKEDPKAQRWVAAGAVPKPEGVPSELADVFVRLLHMCEHYGIDLYEQFRLKMDYNETRTVRHGGKAL